MANWSTKDRDFRRPVKPSTATLHGTRTLHMRVQHSRYWNPALSKQSFVVSSVFGLQSLWWLIRKLKMTPRSTATREDTAYLPSRLQPSHVVRRTPSKPLSNLIFLSHPHYVRHEIKLSRVRDWTLTLYPGYQWKTKWSERDWLRLKKRSGVPQHDENQLHSEPAAFSSVTCQPEVNPSNKPDTTIEKSQPCDPRDNTWLEHDCHSHGNFQMKIPRRRPQKSVKWTTKLLVLLVTREIPWKSTRQYREAAKDHQLILSYSLEIFPLFKVHSPEPVANVQSTSNHNEKALNPCLCVQWRRKQRTRQIYISFAWWIMQTLFGGVHNSEMHRIQRTSHISWFLSSPDSQIVNLTEQKERPWTEPNLCFGAGGGKVVSSHQLWRAKFGRWYCLSGCKSATPKSATEVFRICDSRIKCIWTTNPETSHGDQVKSDQVPLCFRVILWMGIFHSHTLALRSPRIRRMGQSDNRNRCFWCGFESSNLCFSSVAHPNSSWVVAEVEFELSHSGFISSAFARSMFVCEVVTPIKICLASLDICYWWRLNLSESDVRSSLPWQGWKTQNASTLRFGFHLLTERDTVSSERNSQQESLLWNCSTGLCPACVIQHVWHCMNKIIFEFQQFWGDTTQPQKSQCFVFQWVWSLVPEQISFVGSIPIVWSDHNDAQHDQTSRRTKRYRSAWEQSCRLLPQTPQMGHGVQPKLSTGLQKNELKRQLHWEPKLWEQFFSGQGSPLYLSLCISSLNMAEIHKITFLLGSKCWVYSPVMHELQDNARTPGWRFHPISPSLARPEMHKSAVRVECLPKRDRRAAHNEPACTCSLEQPKAKCIIHHNRGDRRGFVVSPPACEKFPVAERWESLVSGGRSSDKEMWNRKKSQIFSQTNGFSHKILEIDFLIITFFSQNANFLSDERFFSPIEL